MHGTLSDKKRYSLSGRVCLYIIEECVNISFNLHYALFGLSEILNERFYVKEQTLRTIYMVLALVGSDFGGFSAYWYNY